MHYDTMSTAPPPSPPSERSGSASPVPGEEGKRVRRRDILNLLNYINFSEGTIFASFRQPERGDRVSYQAFPLPCLDEVLVCRWLPPGFPVSRMKSYVCDGILLSDGHNRVTVKAEVTRLDAEGIAFRLPESGYEKSCRRIERHACEGIAARLLQAGLGFEGRLVDFNALSFRAEIEAKPSGSLRWINAAAPTTVLLSRGEELLYSGECLIKRMDGGLERRSLVLVPNFNNLPRYRPKDYRNERRVLAPVPSMRFLHPLTGKPVRLQVGDISGTGLRVQESFDRSVLLPGLVLPEIVVEIANQFLLKCRAQVLYRNVLCAEGGEDAASCGVVFLDLDIRDQTRLAALLHQSGNDKLRVCGSVDMEELWRFFFDTGFIYPSKYLSMESRREEFRRTYEKLYLESPSIARHFVIEDKGQIFGHMSMVRYYSNSWIIHHHAASRGGKAIAGVEVLDQAGRYCNDFHSHPSTHMDYLMCYYRRENRFPARVFGNIARDIADPKGSSLDTFAYFRLDPETGESEAAFQLFPARDEDFAELRRYYDDASGGLMLDALDLGREVGSDVELGEEYARQGFRRERHVFCLRQEGRLGAVIALTLSDLGLNLSSLTNCVHVIIVDREGLMPDTLFSGLRSLLRHYRAEDVPVLAYPAEYMEARGLPYEKKYVLWVVSLDRSDGYFRSVRNTFRRTCRDTDDAQHGDG